MGQLADQNPSCMFLRVCWCVDSVSGAAVAPSCCSTNHTNSLHGQLSRRRPRRPRSRRPRGLLVLVKRRRRGRRGMQVICQK